MSEAVSYYTKLIQTNLKLLDLLRQLSEKQFRFVGYVTLAVLQNKSHLADLTFDLYHVVQNEVREHC